MRPLRWAFAILSATGAGLILLGTADIHGQQIMQYGFEARGPVWKPGSTDTASKVLKHELTDETAHSGQRCEHIQLQVEPGTKIHYTFDLPRAPITEELNVGLYLKSNRPGIQLFCRVVLPREKDPENLGQPMTLMLRCEPYQGTRWKLISLRQPTKRLREQQQLLTLKYGRDIVVVDAYIDQLVLNVYDGPGLTDVWIDDLEVGPVMDNRPITPALPVPEPGKATAVRRSAEVVLKGNRLLVSGKPFFLRAIRHTGTPLRTLRDAGFNTIWLDESTSPTMIEDAVNLGFWIVPSLHPTFSVSAGPAGAAGQLTANDQFAQKIQQFTSHDAVLAWDLGSNLEAESFTEITRFARAFRNADQQQPVIADVWDGYRGYSRSLEQVMLGTHRWPLMTSMGLHDYWQWLVNRRRLSMDNYSWTWVQTHLPEWFTRMVYQDDGKKGFNEPVGPQPEQIHLLAYVALAAGYRGLAFWSDRFLADSHQGKDRLLAMALLNQELQLLERILVQATAPPEMVPTNRPEVTCAVFRTREGILALPIWMGDSSQLVPDQAAAAQVVLTIPGVPSSATAWEVSPGRIQSYPVRRELGGSQVKLHNFSLTAAVLFTSDLSPTGLVVRLQGQQRRMGRLAAQWLHDQAKEELKKIEKVQAALDSQGHTIPDGNQLLDKARKAIARCMEHRRNGEHTEAYNEAEIALRSLRVLMRAHWNRAVRDLDSPVSSPYAVSFYTLPRHWEMLDQMRKMRPAPTVLPDGGFETKPDLVQENWLVEEKPSLDPVKVEVRRVPLQPRTGKQCLRMSIKPRDDKHVPAVLERTHVLLHSPTIRLQPGTLVRISGCVRIPHQILGNTDGAQIYDSIGGEPLSIRLTMPTPWKKFSLFRKVPASGAVSVTLELSGIGEVYFDDICIEPLLPAGSTVSLPAREERARP